jgi:hypothetical protein
METSFLLFWNVALNFGKVIKEIRNQKPEKTKR